MYIFLKYLFFSINFSVSRKELFLYIRFGDKTKFGEFRHSKNLKNWVVNLCNPEPSRLLSESDDVQLIMSIINNIKYTEI